MVGVVKCVRNKPRCRRLYSREGSRRFNRKPQAHDVPSDEVHEDFILHDAGDLGHPALRHGASLTRHQDLTYADVGDRELEGNDCQQLTNYLWLQLHHWPLEGSILI